ncbi:hypothetical protein E4U19_005837 [Claviceps sp. Clav32 group G5]|nr:hypothetical protein E4U19_005837 [Claviceps sp. Clav32 group G5]
MVVLLQAGGGGGEVEEEEEGDASEALGSPGIRDVENAAKARGNGPGAVYGEAANGRWIVPDVVAVPMFCRIQHQQLDDKATRCDWEVVEADRDGERCRTRGRKARGTAARWA